MSVPDTRQSGFTLIGLLIALGVLAILAGLAMPAWQRQIERHRLKAGLTAVHGALIRARRESILLNRPLVFLYRAAGADPDWCFVIADDPDCDCHAEDCAFPPGTRRPVRTVDLPALTLGVLPRRGWIRFYPARGTTSAGSVELTVGDASARVVVSSLGRIRVCSPSLPGYPPCR